MGNSFRTSDIWLAAFLIAGGNSLAEVDRRNPRRVDFILARWPTAEEQRGFDTGDGLVKIGPLMAALRRLKRALYDHAEGGGRYD